MEPELIIALGTIFTGVIGAISAGVGAISSARINAIERVNEGLIKEISRLTERANNADERADKEAAEKCAIEDERDDLKDKMRILSGELNTLRSETSKAIANLEKKLTDTEYDRDQRISELETIRDQLSAQVEKLTADLLQVREELDREREAKNKRRKSQ